MPLLEDLLEKVGGSSGRSEEGALALEEVESLPEEEIGEELTLGEADEILGEAEEEETFGEEVEAPEPVGVGKEEEARPEGALEDLEDKMDDLTAEVSRLRADASKAQSSIDDFQGRLRRLLGIYNIVFRGANPFEDEPYKLEEDVFDVLKEFIHGGVILGRGEGGGDLERRLTKLENRVNEFLERPLEEVLEEELEEAGEEEKPEEEEGLEEDYEAIFREAGEEKPEVEEEEIPEAKWEVGTKVLGPEGEEVNIVDRQWDSFRQKWQYKCKPVGGGG